MENLPSVRHLRHLIALAEHEHFGRAAEACFVTQSTLSASLKEFESLLGAQLVDRSKRHFALTPLGVDTVVCLIFGYLGYRATRVAQMTTQYRWINDRAGFLRWAWRTTALPGKAPDSG